MPNYTLPCSDDTPILELPVDSQEKSWLSLHAGHAMRLEDLGDGEFAVLCTTCNAYIIQTEDVADDPLPPPGERCVVCELPFSELDEDSAVELECGDGWAHAGHECYGEHAGGCSICPIGGDA